MRAGILIVIFFWSIVACSIIIGSNNTMNNDRDNGIIIEDKPGD